MKTVIEQLSGINKIKDNLFLDMCSGILSELHGKPVVIKTIEDFKGYSKKSPYGITALLDKCHHMIYNIGSPDSVLPFLKRVATKKKKQTQPGWTHSPGEFLGICHFRWNWKGQTLTDDELKALKSFLNKNDISTDQPSEYEQQANSIAEKHGIVLSVLDKEFKKYFTDDKEERWVFDLKLIRNKKSYTFTFGQSLNAGSKSPNMYDVLSCLTKYDPGTFEDFCSEYGYEEDSRSAEKTYKAVCKEWKSVENLFSDILEELQEIQ
jgi:hypothetical protein